MLFEEAFASATLYCKLPHKEPYLGACLQRITISPEHSINKIKLRASDWQQGTWKSQHARCSSVNSNGLLKSVGELVLTL